MDRNSVLALLFRVSAVIALIALAVVGYPSFVKWRVENQSVGEITAVLKSDPAFKDLSVSVKHRKGTHVIIAGPIPDVWAWNELQNRIRQECSSTASTMTAFDLYVPVRK